LTAVQSSATKMFQILGFWNIRLHLDSYDTSQTLQRYFK